MRHITRPAVPLLRFLGATDTVTGSRFLVDPPHARVLIDCGLFQGLKALRLRNWKPFPVAPETIDAVRADARTSRPHGLPAGPGPAAVSRDAFLPRRKPETSAGSCYPTAGTSRRRTRRTRIGKASRNTRRRCHLRQRLPNPRNTVILVGFQTEGTCGRSFLDGARSVKMLSRYVPVRAEVVHVPAFSVHADQIELLDWVRMAPQPPDMTFVVHGEHTPAEAFRTTIEATLGWTVAVPHYLEQVRLDEEKRCSVLSPCTLTP